MNHSSPLTPMQRTMLLQGILGARSGRYILQMTGTLPEEFDPSAFDAAWQHVRNRHDALRASFGWSDADEPRPLTAPFRFIDVSENAAADQAVAVIAREDKPGQVRLVAYVVLPSPSEEILPTLREFAAERLPSYMVPMPSLLRDPMIKALARIVRGEECDGGRRSGLRMRGTPGDGGRRRRLRLGCDDPGPNHQQSRSR